MRKLTQLALSVALAALTLPAYASTSPFRIADIRLEGLERISAGTVFTYLPVEKGDLLDPASTQNAIRALYRTGFFSDIKVERDGEVLVLRFVERPAISKIELSGNKDVKTDDLLKALSSIGLAEGEVYNRLSLDRVEQELTRQYFNRGKYNVRVRSTVTELERNRVEIAINVREGRPAKVKHLNIVGNRAFDDDDLTLKFKQDTTNWTSWYTSDDQYSREKLTGDLETLRSYYLDRGYADFDVESTQVQISPDKSEVYLTVNIREGEVYTFGTLELAGNTLDQREALNKMIFQTPGETFSRGSLEATSKAITAILNNQGYAFAEVTPSPRIDRETRKVDVSFLVEPGPRVLVSRVSINGNLRTEDEVIRRELRQFEGTWFNQAAINLSKARLMRTGYFSKVEIENPKVPGADDQVELVVEVEERTAGNFTFQFGYSAVQQLILQVGLNQSNFLGTGNRIGVEVESSALYKRYALSFTDPYWTEDGISRGFSLTYREFDRTEATFADYTTDQLAFNTNFSIPINEFDRVFTGIGPDWTRINIIPGLTPADIENFVFYNGSKYFSLRGNVGWQRDTRNQRFAPTAGYYQRFGAEIALPGSDIEYYKLDYGVEWYWPFRPRWSLLFRTNIGYGDGYGNNDLQAGIGSDGSVCPDDQSFCQEPPTAGLPFFENFYAGGSESVRGYDDFSLGPRVGDIVDPDTGVVVSRGAVIGGAFSWTGGIEVILPNPIERAQDTAQFSWFFDFGQVYPTIEDFEARELRMSTGLSVRWQAPLAPLKISIAFPFNDDRLDRTETLQFGFIQDF